MAGETVRRYRLHGFAVVLLRAGSPDGVLGEMAQALDLDDPFVPPLYRRSGTTVSPVSRISAGLNARTDDADHPSFGRTSGQRLHTDGTLQAIGEIRTTLLLCQAQGISGGETILLNSTGAFLRLVDEDPEAAAALATPGVLVRQANINGCTDENRLPAFAVVDDEVLTAYSRTGTDRWETPDGVDAAALRRGTQYLEACEADPDLYRELVLAPDQLFVLSNATLSHGRRAYVDSPSRKRCMLRTLHTRTPSVAPSMSTAGVR